MRSVLLARPFALSLSLVLLAGHADPQAVKLSAPMAPLRSGDVTHALLAPDGATLVFLADRGVSGVKELYAAPIDGGGPTRRLTDLYGTDDRIVLGVNAPVPQVAGTRVVFVLDEPIGSVPTRFLHSVPHDASAPPVRLSDEQVIHFRLTADGTRVVFTADDRIWSVPADGSQPPLALATIPALATSDLSVTPDGTRAIYLSSLPFSNVKQLYSVRTDGSEAPLAIGPALPAPQSIAPGSPNSDGPRLTPDGQHAVFIVESFPNGTLHRLFSAPVDGSGPAQELTGLVTSFSRFTLAPDSRWVVVTGRRSADAQLELQRFPIAGGAAVRISARGPGNVRVFEIAPDASAVVYTRELGSDGFLHVARLDRRQAAPPSARRLATVAGTFAVTPDSRRVVCRSAVSGEILALSLGGNEPPIVLGAALPVSFGVTGVFTPDGTRTILDGDDGTRVDHYSVPLDGSAAPVALTTSVDELDSFNPFLVASDAHVSFLAIESSSGTELDATELFRVPITGGAAVRLNEPLPSGYGDVGPFTLTPAGTRVVYRANHAAEFRFELYGAPTDGSQPATLLSDFTVAPDAQASVSDFHVGPDGQYVFYVANGEANPGFAVQTLLYRAPTDGSAPPDRLVERSVQQVAATIQVSPDGAHVAYLATEIASSVGLFSVPTDASRARIHLAAAWVRDDFLITADSARVVFRRGATQGATVNDLYSVPLLGGAPPVLLATDVASFRVTPDGASVVYRAAAGGLFAVAVDGSLPPVALNGGLPAVSTYEVGGASQYAVFIAGTQLASARIDGSSGPIGLSASVPNLFVDSRLALGSGAVLYSMRNVLETRADLHIVSVDGAFGPALLNAPWPGQNRIAALGLSEDPQRAVYSADQDVSGRLELYSVRFNGTDRVRLSPPLVAGGDTNGFRIAADGTVIYAADQEVDDVIDLFAVPVTGGAAVRASGPQSPGGDVQSFELGADRVIYRADQDLDGVLELYSSPF
jgi:hypothetical protein